MKFIKLVGTDYTEFRQNLHHARHRIKKAAWDMAPVGRCRIIGPNGRVVAHVNGDPGETPEGSGITEEGATVSEAVMAIELDTMKRLKNSGHMQQAPHPKNCKCRWWPGKEDVSVDSKDWPKQHHQACPFGTVYARQRGGIIKHVSSSKTNDPVIHHGGKPVNPSNPKPSLLGRPSGPVKVGKKIDEVPPPKGCPKCKDFTKSKNMAQDQHHPGCIYYAKYLAISKAQGQAGVAANTPKGKDERPYLYDLKTQKAVRPAEPDEVAEARERLRDESAALCKVDGTQYLVMLLDGSQLEPAPPEAIETTADTEPPSPMVNEEDADRSLAEAAQTVE